jgi:beta-glucuronidase
MYYTWQEEFSPAVMDVRKTESGKIEVTVTARNDFPKYTLRNYKLKVGGQVLDIPTLAPGEHKIFSVDLPPNQPDKTIELLKPGGFVILKR